MQLQNYLLPLLALITFAAAAPIRVHLGEFYNRVGVIVRSTIRLTTAVTIRKSQTIGRTIRLP